MLMRRCLIPQSGVWRQICRRQYSEGATIGQYLREKREKSPSVLRQSLSPKPQRKVSVLSQEKKDRTRHLLRALLRECSYLPDSQTRKWTTNHALARYRETGFKVWEHRFDPDYEERLRKQEKEARSALALLRRANEGERDCLLRVMLMAYGRIGKRRHELMQPLLPVKGQMYYDVKSGSGENGSTPLAETFKDTIDVRTEESTAFNSNPAPTNNFIPTKPEDGPYVPLTRTLSLPPQLRALLISQSRAAPPSLVRPNPRRLNPDIPETNIWGRLMPQKRIKNMKREHYAYLLDRVHTPLPIQEWERLRGLAEGETAMERVPGRRKAVGPTLSKDLGQSVDGAATALELVVMYGKAPKKIFEQFNGHAITPRFMQRLYATIFALCPKMEWDVKGERWEITWGARGIRSGGRRARRREHDLGKGEGGGDGKVADKMHTVVM